MIFQDNIMKEYLRNVYFITGTPCGGKTTVSKALGAKYGFPVYDVDERFDLHRSLSDERHQPNMNKLFKDADEFFGRSVEDYKAWLRGSRREQLDFILLDLIRLSQNGIVICDCHLTFGEAEILSVPSRIVFMLREPTGLVEEYSSRPDHQDFRAFLHSASDVEKAKNTVNTTLYEMNAKYYNDVKNSNYFWVERDGARTKSETLALVEKHFGWAASQKTS